MKVQHDISTTVGHPSLNKHVPKVIVSYDMHDLKITIWL